MFVLCIVYCVLCIGMEEVVVLMLVHPCDKCRLLVAVDVVLRADFQ